MDPIDREVLALRHFEQLNNAEVAATLQINESTASSRYLRALKRLKDEVKHIPGLIDALSAPLDSLPASPGLHHGFNCPQTPDRGSTRRGIRRALSPRRAAPP